MNIPKKIKVLHVVEALGGGVYSYFRDLADIFGNDSRVSTIIVYSDLRTEINPDHVRTDFHEKVKTVLIQMSREINLKNDSKSIKALIKVFNDEKPDIIHLHSSKAGVLGRIAYTLSSVKTNLYYTPHGYAFLQKDKSRNSRKFYKLIEKYTQKFFGGTTIACGATEAKESTSLGLKTKLISNGVPVDSIRNFKREHNNKNLTIGILGRITFARNPEFFNEIALAHPDISFIWIGDGELRHLITSPNIEITGWFTNKENAYFFLNSIDVYLQTSLWEGLPIALLEAMALEKPIIATNIIGNKDVVNHGETGYLINDLEDFNKSIELLKDKNKRKKMGDAALKRVVKEFNSDTNFKKLIELYLNDYSNKN
jgi:hypothetical protein